MSVRGQAGVPEQRQPRRQLARSLLQPRDGLLLADVWGIGVDALDECAPQLGLPVQIGVEAVCVAVEPVDEQLRTLAGVGGEQSGQPSCHRIPSAPSQLGLIAGIEVAEVPGQDGAPRLIERGVDGFDQRPRHRIG